MTATRNDILEWISEAKEKGCTHLVIAVDTFDYENYPCFVMPGESVEQCVKNHTGNMQRVDEVYSFTDKWTLAYQLKEHRAYHLD